MLTGNAEARAEDGAAWVSRLCRELEIPPLATYGVRPEDVAALVEKAAQASSMKGNPIALTPDELAEVLTRAL
jgi:alcohol dehydrogenase class IV